MAHFKTLCKECGKVVNTCRCPSKDKEIKYSICQECLDDKVGHLSEEKQQSFDFTPYTTPPKG